MDQNPTFPRGIEVTCACLVRNSDKKLLLIQSPKWSGMWVLPGGHVDPGEKITEAAKRETREETGLEADSVTIIRFDEAINPPTFHRPIHLVYFDCLVEVTNTDVILDHTEATAFVWVTPDEALKMDLGSGFENDLNGYIDYLKNEKH